MFDTMGVGEYSQSLPAKPAGNDLEVDPVTFQADRSAL
jgi:hypothetical protein